MLQWYINYQLNSPFVVHQITNQKGKFNRSWSVFIVITEVIPTKKHVLVQIFKKQLWGIQCADKSVFWQNLRYIFISLSPYKRLTYMFFFILCGVSLLLEILTWIEAWLFVSRLSRQIFGICRLSLTETWCFQTFATKEIRHRDFCKRSIRRWHEQN